MGEKFHITPAGICYTKHTTNQGDCHVSEIDQQFIEYVVKSLVGKPDAVQVDRSVDEKGVLLELTVDPEDLGRVIGKRGATAQSLRTLLRALGTKNDARYNLKIIDNGLEPKERKPREDHGDKSAAENKPAEAANDEQPASNKEDTSASEIAEAIDDQDKEDYTSDRVRRTREELADLDDLDL